MANCPGFWVNENKYPKTRSELWLCEKGIVCFSSFPCALQKLGKYFDMTRKPEQLNERVSFSDLRSIFVYKITFESWSLSKKNLIDKLRLISEYIGFPWELHVCVLWIDFNFKKLEVWEGISCYWKPNCFIFSPWSVKLSHWRQCYELKENLWEQNIVLWDK